MLMAVTLGGGGLRFLRAPRRRHAGVPSMRSVVAHLAARDRVYDCLTHSLMLPPVACRQETVLEMLLFWEEHGADARARKGELVLGAKDLGIGAEELVGTEEALRAMLV